MMSGITTDHVMLSVSCLDLVTILVLVLEDIMILVEM
jgi:hypothetical protein